jgi:predicted ATP-grasp superfamily ATP-dependent carboligase
MRNARSSVVRPGANPLVLVSDHVDGRSRSAVAAVRALGAAGYRPVVTVSGGRSAAAASRSSAGVLHVPRPGSPGYREAVEEYLAAHPGAAVLAASDAVLVALDQPGADLVDKAVLPERAAAAGLRTPATREFADSAGALDAADDLDYPVVVKAAVKTRPTDVARRVDSPRELPAVLEHLTGSVVVQPFAVGAMRAVCGVIADGRLLAAVHQRYVRIWPPGCGTASAAVTTDPDLELEALLPRLLAGHAGVFQVQLIEDEVIDVNPRVYGSLPLAVAAGANLPAIACDAAAGRYSAGVVRARPGVRYRWLEGDVRRVLHDLREGILPLRAAGGALLPRAGTAHSVESLRDPGPGLVRLMDVARRRLP